MQRNTSTAVKKIQRVTITKGFHEGTELKFVSIPRKDAFRVRAARQAAHGHLSIHRSKKDDTVWVAEIVGAGLKRKALQVAEATTPKAAYKQAVPFWLM